MFLFPKNCGFCMLQISIDASLKQAAPRLALGVVQAPVKVTKHDPELWEEIRSFLDTIGPLLTLDDLSEVPEIKALRDAYRAIGKDPARYRGSQEALLRRVLQGKELYQINTIVDINNFVSLKTKHSLGSYNVANLQPPIVFRIGNQGESYKGIGKEMINIAELPVFADSIGPFGSPTSDSERAMITPNTTEIMMMVIAFSGVNGLSQSLQRIADLLSTYATSPKESIRTLIVQ